MHIWRPCPGLAQGDIFTAQLEFSTPENTSYARARRADGVYLDAAAQQVAVVGRQGGLAGAARQLREELCSALTRLLGQQVGSVARAAAFGDKSALNSELNEMFRAAGLSHVLVVSGLHFSAASGALYAFLRTKLRRRAAAAAAGGLVLWLLFLTGFGPSAVRSAVALLMLYGGMLAWRRSDGRTSMGVAGVLLCVFTGPDAALDVGAQLSFCAALAVVWAGEQTAVWNKREPGRFSFLLRPVRDALFVSACACLATLPALCAAGLGASLFTPAGKPAGAAQCFLCRAGRAGGGRMCALPAAWVSGPPFGACVRAGRSLAYFRVQAVQRAARPGVCQRRLCAVCGVRRMRAVVQPAPFPCAAAQGGTGLACICRSGHGRLCTGRCRRGACDAGGRRCEPFAGRHAGRLHGGGIPRRCAKRRARGRRACPNEPHGSRPCAGRPCRAAARGCL